MTDHEQTIVDTVLTAIGAMLDERFASLRQAGQEALDGLEQRAGERIAEHVTEAIEQAGKTLEGQYASIYSRARLIDTGLTDLGVRLDRLGRRLSDRGVSRTSLDFEMPVHERIARLEDRVRELMQAREDEA